MSNLEKLQQLLAAPTNEQMLEVILEKDQPFGKEVMDIVRAMSTAKEHIPSPMGVFKFQPIWSFGKLTYVVSLTDKDLHTELVAMQRDQWSKKHKDLMEELYGYPDGYHAACKAYDLMQGNYPALKVFDTISKAYFQVKRKEKRDPTNGELIALKIDPGLKRSKIALHAIRHFDT